MANFIIKTHKKGNVYKSEHFFILNKGLNSGKPLNEPCANCFVIVFSSSEERENLYWTAVSLWKSKFWHPFLVGSVIPFLRLPELKKEFFLKAKEILADFESHKKDVAALRLLEQKEKQFHENINLINDIRRVILYRYIKQGL
jgi:hypothetical protein